MTENKASIAIFVIAFTAMIIPTFAIANAQQSATIHPSQSGKTQVYNANNAKVIRIDTGKGVIVINVSPAGGSGAGPAGPAGPQGIPGEKGEKGDRGEKGDQGIQGVPGEKGDQGERGIQGEQGLQGIPGTAGANGSKGEQGIQGAQGIPGEKGEKGDKGEAGNSTICIQNETDSCISLVPQQPGNETNANNNTLPNNGTIVVTPPTSNETGNVTNGNVTQPGGGNVTNPNVNATEPTPPTSNNGTVNPVPPFNNGTNNQTGNIGSNETQTNPSNSTSPSGNETNNKVAMTIMPQFHTSSISYSGPNHNWLIGIRNS
jgi:hypothetical protein